MSRRAAGLAIALVALLLMVIGSAPASAQTYFAISVSGQRGISYGTMYRSSTSSVSYASASAAEFSLIGVQTGRVRITVTTSNPTRNSTPMVMAVTQPDCAFSLDNGATWTRFTSGTLYQDAVFPIDNISGLFRGTIKVRVGGAVTASSTQQRGLYSGSVTVSAVYR